MAFSLKINTQIWTMNTEEGKLFEYEQFENSQKKSITFNKKKPNFFFTYTPTCKDVADKTISENNEIIIKNRNIKPEEIQEYKIFEVENEKESVYLIKSLQDPNPKKKLEGPGDIDVERMFGWIILRKLHDNNDLGIKLREGDILKLGRITFKIRETNFKKKLQNKLIFSNNNELNDILNINMDKNKNTKLNISSNNSLMENNIVRNLQNNEIISNIFNKNINNQINYKDNPHLNHINQQTLRISNNNNENNNDMVFYNNKLNLNESKESMKIKSIKNNTSNDENMCRVCLGINNSSMNPLLNVCKCQGSVAFIHLECLKHWLDSKLITKTYAYLIVHSFKDLKCEICKEILPERIKINNKVQYLIDLKLPTEEEYIILETLSNEKKDVKFLYIIHMPNNTRLLMGRSTDCDIRMTDISISRIHSYLENKDGEFYYKDNNSKFGSLIKQQGDILILPYKNMCIQYDEVLVNFQLDISFQSKICCKENDLFNSFLNYNDFFKFRPHPADQSIKTIKIDEFSKKSSISSNKKNYLESNSLILHDNIMTNRPNKDKINIEIDLRNPHKKKSSESEKINLKILCQVNAPRKTLKKLQLK